MNKRGAVLFLLGCLIYVVLIVMSTIAERGCT